MKKSILIFSSILFMLMIFIQHHFVMMYFDDYGYASLSYGWTENKAGMSYTLLDMAKFLSWHYFNWGGRIIYYFLEAAVFRIGGVELIQATQAMILILIGIVTGKIVAVAAKCDSYIGIAVIFVLYGTMHIQTLRDGVYWYSASVGYVWPLLPLFGSMYLLNSIQQKETNLKKGTAAVLMFLAAFSQEQTAVLAVVWILGMICFQYFFGKKNENDRNYVPQYMLVMGVSALIGSVLTVFAPGNFVRAGDERYADFYSKSMIERIAGNTGNILDINIGAYNWIFVIIVTFFCGTAVAMYFKNRYLYIVVYLFAGYFFIEQRCSIPNVFGMFVRSIWTICFAISLFLYYYKRKNYLFLSMLGAGICSQGVMVLSPSISMRCHTMLEFLLHLIVAECMVSIVKMASDKKAYTMFYRVPMLLAAIYAVWNSCTIIYGYKSNYEANEINHYKLVEAQKKRKAGKEEQEVLLYKLYDDTYANCMPYHPNFDFIEVWMKKYYELPNEMDFYWMDLEGDPDLQLVDGLWYQDKWLGKTAVFSVKAEEDRILEMIVMNPEAIQKQQIRCKIAEEEKVYEFSAGETKSIEIHIPAGRHELAVSSVETFVPKNGDKRELSAILDFKWH